MSAPYAQKALGPLPYARSGGLKAVKFWLLLTAMRLAAKLGLRLMAVVMPLPRSQRPTLLKTYPANPHLTHRVFYPPNYSSNSRLPLFLDIHGGGFCVAEPFIDDAVNAALAKRNECLVISLDYSKGPMKKFPVAHRELVATVQSILGDISLPFDRTRVVIGGYSAGGNLSLSVSQARSLQGKIHGVVAWYPVTDFTTSTAHKCETRPYEKPGDKDMLSKNGPAFNWGYIANGEDLRDPLLSPTFAKREALPEWLCVVGAEYDMLCQEAALMMGAFAGVDMATDWSARGGLGSAGIKLGFESKEGRDKWMLVKGAQHGFTHPLPRVIDEPQRQALADRNYAEVGEWLLRGPFKERSK